MDLRMASRRERMDFTAAIENDRRQGSRPLPKKRQYTERVEQRVNPRVTVPERRQYGANKREAVWKEKYDKKQAALAGVNVQIRSPMTRTPSQSAQTTFQRQKPMEMPPKEHKPGVNYNKFETYRDSAYVKVDLLNMDAQPKSYQEAIKRDGRYEVKPPAKTSRDVAGEGYVYDRKTPSSTSQYRQYERQPEYSKQPEYNQYNRQMSQPVYNQGYNRTNTQINKTPYNQPFRQNNQPIYNQSSRQPSYSQSSRQTPYNQPVYGTQPGRQPSYGQNTQPNYRPTPQSGYNQTVYNQSNYPQPTPQYGQPAYNQGNYYKRPTPQYPSRQNSTVNQVPNSLRTPFGAAKPFSSRPQYYSNTAMPATPFGKIGNFN